MVIGIYNPYLDSLSGGERYVLTLASHWSKVHTVVLFWDDASFLRIAGERFDLDLSRVKTTQNFFKKNNVWEKLFLSRKYDVIFFLSDGSVPTSLAKKNILHFQVPFKHIDLSFWKKLLFQSVVCNSYFTKEHLDPRIGKKATVIYPPVHLLSPEKRKKEKIIISVGRFSSYFQSKKQEVLIDAMRKIQDSHALKGWKLVLAGGLLSSDREYFTKLEHLSKNLPIELLPNISYQDLTSLYQKASLYWHAAGFGETKPERMEHFGITTVEAMSAGCIPIVYNGGGQREIIEHGSNGFTWNTIRGLLDATEYCIHNPVSAIHVRKKAQERAQKFDEQVFCNTFDDLLDNLV